MKKRVKCMIAFLLMLVTVMACAIPASATWMYPDGGSVYRNIVNTDNYNRTIYVYHRDNYGNLLKYCEYYTGTIGEYEVFGDSIYGYEITGYESNQGLGEQCVLTWASGNESTAAYGQIGYQFYKLISKKSLTLNFTYRVHEATTFNIKHYIVDKNGNKTLYDSSTASYTYGNNMSIYRKYPTGYSLRDGYAASITGPFTYDVLNSGKNVESRLYYDRVWGSRRGEMYDWKSFTWTNKDWLDYCRNREINVTFIYDIDKYTIDFNANGGSGAPTAITKYYGENITIPSTTPTRNGYTFKGWGTTINDTTPKYQPGSTYTSNSGRTLYAIWESNSPSTYTVSYNANGGSGAPASQTKTKDVILTLSSIKPTRNGYSFMGWSTSSTATAPTYSAGGSYTDNASVTLYAVWSYNSTPTPTPVTTYTVSYNANGGSGAPASQSKTEGTNLVLSSATPYRSGYRFLGWSTSSTATYPTYYAGSTYSRDASVTLYAVWERTSSETYTIRYNANGGSGAPSTQYKTEGIALTLSSVEPSRTGYNFLGWSTSSTATSATYSPGDRYTANTSVTLYAVWEQTNYEFSISNLTVTDSNPYRYDEITVKVRTDSWDNVNPHSNIPVQLYYDGQLMSTQYVDFAAYGVANLIFTLYVGDTPGNHSIEARVNWQNRSNETNADNNSVSTSITVRDFDDFDYEMSVVPVTMSDDYVAGDTVISSFTVRNDSDYDIIPDMGNKVIFTAYYYDGSQKNVIANDTWNNVVIPSGKANLVYFKWTVPSNLTGKTVYCECTINADHSLNEENLDNNTSTFSTTIASSADSQTPDTRYESSKPNSYKGYRVPANSTEKATWTMWVYENNQFVLKTYGVQISTDSPVITPSAECKTAVYSDGKWTIRSGYGFTISYAPTITTVIGCTNPENSAYTGVQYAYATFPEFNYSGSDGSYRTLELDNGKFRFIANAYSIISDRVHFIPVWFEDGTYTVSVTASRVWTPAGMIHATRTANTFNIDGSIFDDYYVGN